MNEIDSKKLRIILNEIAEPKLRKSLSEMSDDDLSETNIINEFQLDSLDVEELFAEIYYQYGIRISDADIDKFREEPTGGNFIRICNDCGYGV